MVRYFTLRLNRVRLFLLLLLPGLFLGGCAREDLQQLKGVEVSEEVETDNGYGGPVAQPHPPSKTHKPVAQPESDEPLDTGFSGACGRTCRNA